jgi:hypothetical protein
LAAARTGCPGAGQLLQPDAGKQAGSSDARITTALAENRWGGTNPATTAGANDRATLIAAKLVAATEQFCAH